MINVDVVKKEVYMSVQDFSFIILQTGIFVTAILSRHASETT